MDTLSSEIQHEGKNDMERDPENEEDSEARENNKGSFSLLLLELPNEPETAPAPKQPWETSLYSIYSKELHVFASHEITIIETPDSYGGVVWPGALALCQFLENNHCKSTKTNQFNLETKSVGPGNRKKAGTRIALQTSTDLPGVLGNLRMNLNRNTRGKCRYLPQVAVLEWGSNLEEAYPKSVYRYEVVLAADVVYHHNCLDELLITMEHFCQPGTVLLWSNKYRFTTDHKFAEMFHNTFHTTLLAEFPDTEVKIYMATIKDKQ
ncbi:protein-lysine methyltransferase METTL21C-like [Huso huso]|uniref:Protein-lysine methyltransferase METTL21C-like n=1 Tax=Huso huso TaxID=61971 RepID=A0ABR0ZQP0_HUSHU